MDEAKNRYARELADAITAALARDPAVRACRDRARAAGVELEVSLDVGVGVKSRGGACAAEGTTTGVIPSAKRQQPPDRPLDVTAADRRFLRSLRISADETSEPTA